MRRRSFVGMAAGLAVASWPQSSEPEPAPGRRISQEAVAQALRRTARLRRLDDYLGGVDTYQLYLAEVEATNGLLQCGTYSQTTGQRLLALLAEQAQLAGFSALDANWQAEAERLFQISLTAAQDADDRALIANALTFLGYQSVGLGSSGVDLSVASCDLAAGSTPGVRALAHERCAWAHAAAGHLTETERYLGLAEAALDQDDDRPEPDWVFWVNRTEIQIMSGRCWTQLRRPLRAIGCLEAALDTYSDTHSRDKAMYLSYLAQAYLDANEVEQACAVADRAVDLATDVRSVRPQQRVAVLARQLGPYHGLSTVDSLLARVDEWATQVRSLPGAPTRRIEASWPSTPLP